MLTAIAAPISGQARPVVTSARHTAAARAPAGSIVTVHHASTTSSGAQLTLALTTGWHAGPLFIVQKRRAPVIHGGTLGGKRRRQREARATPKWADRAAMCAMYRKAKLLSKSTGEMHVVDHIVPLDGKLVCGLHWHENMRVIHWRDNAVKSWHTWPDMPFEQLELL